MKIIKNKRVSCAGKCGTMVLREIGECRDCRRARVRAGQKRLAKLGKKKDIFSQVVHFFASKKIQFEHSKAVFWNRPKQNIRGLHIPERYDPKIHQMWIGGK